MIVLRFLARDLRAVGVAELSNLGKDEEKGTYFNVTAIISSLKADGALYKVSLISFVTHSSLTGKFIISLHTATIILNTMQIMFYLLTG